MKVGILLMIPQEHKSTINRTTELRTQNSIHPPTPQMQVLETVRLDSGLSVSVGFVFTDSTHRKKKKKKDYVNMVQS